jgi:transposase InsO family protein
MHHASRPPGRKRLSWESRCDIVIKVHEGLSAAEAAESSGVHRSTVYRLLERFASGGWPALKERRPVPVRQPRRTPREDEQQVIALRKALGAGPITLGAILGMPPSTVGKILRRYGCSRRERPPSKVYPRYEREVPGDLIHIDVKRLGRFFTPGKRILGDGIQRSPRAGWQYLHVAIDDHTRLAYAEILTGQGKDASCAFLTRSTRWFEEQLGSPVREVMTDNGHAYRSHDWRLACDENGVSHIRTRPYTPRTNGKAERFIKTMLDEWAYRYSYRSSQHRTRALAGWVRWYNRRRPHASLGGRPPVSRVAQECGQHS